MGEHGPAPHEDISGTDQDLRDTDRVWKPQKALELVMVQGTYFEKNWHIVSIDLR